MLAVQDAVASNSRNSHFKLRKLVNHGRHAAHTSSLGQLPETACPPGPDNPLGVVVVLDTMHAKP